MSTKKRQQKSGPVAAAAAGSATPIARFRVVGEVEKGDQRGRTLNMPTANVAVQRSGANFPLEGVYAGIVTLPDGSAYRSAISLGRRPTFYAESFELCEAHLLDFDGDLYGQHIEITLTHFLRPQLRFASVDELIVQMRADCDLARQVLRDNAV